MKSDNFLLLIVYFLIGGKKAEKSDEGETRGDEKKASEML